MQYTLGGSTGTYTAKELMFGFEGNVDAVNKGSLL
jgi:hypothetical protein